MQVRVNDRGSRTQHAGVLLQGVPVTGVIDMGADITIMNCNLLRKAAVIVNLKKSQFKKADKRPRTYEFRVFSLDGRLDLHLTFGDPCLPKDGRS